MQRPRWGRGGVISSPIGNLSPKWEPAESHQGLISSSRLPETSPAQSFRPEGTCEPGAGEGGQEPRTREESRALLRAEGGRLPAALSRDPGRDRSGPSPDLRDVATGEAKFVSVIEGKGELWSFLPPGPPVLG